MKWPLTLVLYFATTLVSVAILLYSVNELAQRSVALHVDGTGTAGEE